MKLKELEELKTFNEFDMLLILIDKADSIKTRTEKIIKGNKSAGVDVRKVLQDIRMLSEIIRDEIQRRKLNSKSKSKLDKAISSEKKRLAREEARIKKIEENRFVQR
jgi:hypothetical protein